MSFFGKLWGGIKSVGGFVGKIITSKKTAAVVNAAASVVNTAQAGQLSQTDIPDPADKPSGQGWLSFLNGNNPLDLNKYITLPTVSTTVKPVNWLMIGGIAIAAILLLKKRGGRRYA